MDELDDLLAAVTADRFAQQALWANFLRFIRADPKKVADLGKESVAGLEASFPAGDRPEFASAVIEHHRAFWTGLQEQFVEQQLPRGD